MFKSNLLRHLILKFGNIKANEIAPELPLQPLPLKEIAPKIEKMGLSVLRE
jgi:hypothetical protein